MLPHIDCSDVVGAAAATQLHKLVACFGPATSASCDQHRVSQLLYPPRNPDTSYQDANRRRAEPKHNGVILPLRALAGVNHICGTTFASGTTLA